MNMQEIKTGTKIAYTCGYGRLDAVVEGVVLSPNSLGEMNAWLDLEIINPISQKKQSTRIHASGDSLKMFKVEILSN